MILNFKKKLFWIILILISAIIILIVLAYRVNNWKLELENTATLSSCRSVDLNTDGILDIIIGAGGKEHEITDNGVLAIDGKNGQILWSLPSRDQVVGSAIFLDITGDGIKDVFIGGRKNQLWAINGANGSIIWEYQNSIKNFEKKDKRLLNFFNPQFIPDQDGDKIHDILIPFGGYVHADKYDTDRPPGKLLVFSSKSGKQLAKYIMPDEKETYLTPVVYDFRNDGNPYVIFGSGGETIKGNLYAIRLSSIIKNDSKTLIKLADGIDYGFIATPVLADITNDDIPDIIVNAFNGRMIAFNGLNFETIWNTKVGYLAATFSSVAPVDVNNDGTLDFFGSYGVGIWNDFNGALQVVLDGKTGKELLRFKLGEFQYSSPIVADFTKDGKDDVLLHVNYTKKTYSDTADVKKTYFNKLTVFDLQNKKIFNIEKDIKGSNLCSTPLITDLDDDKKLDILYCINSNENDIFSDEKLIIHRREIKLNPSNKIVWGTYMGSNYDGIFTRKH